MTRYLVWMDFETWVQRSAFEAHSPIEFAMVVTDLDYNVIPTTYGDESVTTVRIAPQTQAFSFDHYEFFVKHARETMNPKVFQMHADSGLLQDLWIRTGYYKEDFPSERDYTRSHADCINRMESHIRNLDGVDYDNAEFYLAGAGVSHYDSTILSNFFPSVTHRWLKCLNHLQPVTYDISVLHRFAKGWVSHLDDPEFFEERIVREGQAHRALSDVLYSIEMAKVLRSELT